MGATEAIKRLETDDYLTLWSLQRLEAWEKFKKQGYLRGDGRRIWPEFREPYSWMMRKMKKRIIEKPSKRGFPIWAWYYPKPDLRSSGHLPANSIGVRIELKIHKDRMLASCFNYWHCVLNDSPAVKTEKEFDELYENTKETKKTWVRIFDFNWLNNNNGADPGWETKANKIQAVMYEIFINDVQSIQIFKAR